MNSSLATKTAWEPAPPGLGKDRWTTAALGRPSHGMRLGRWTQRPKPRFSDRLQDTAADVLAYVFMVVFLPVITSLVYLATTGMKPGWRWLLRLLRLWIVVCFAPFFKLRQFLKDRHDLLALNGQ